MLWLKALAPAVVGAVGVGAFVVARASDDPSGAPHVWIDGPRVGSVLTAGPVTVTAHVTAGSGITGLRLVVDGTEVGRDDQLDTHDLLSYGALAWRAEPGTHTLEVRQVGGAGVRSDVRLVEVRGTAPAPGPTKAPSPTSTPSASASTSATPSATPTSPPTSASPTAAPAPVIESATFVGTPTVYTSSTCGYAVTVRATTSNATAASVVVDGTSQTIAMSGSAGSWTATIRSGFDSSEVGLHQVTVYASGTSTASRAVGTLTIRSGCAKD